jgi:TonB family protein
MIGSVAALMLEIIVTPADRTRGLASDPVMITSRPSIQPDDYPIEAIRKSEFGIVSTLLDVSAAGRVTSCVVTETSGAKSLDEATCRLIVARAAFEPARDATGTAISGTYRSANLWAIEERRPLLTYDIAVEVGALPVGYARPVAAKLVFDDSGRVSGCELTTMSGSAEADAAACSYALKRIKLKPPKAENPGVAAAAVRFVRLSVSVAPSDGRTQH